MTYKKNLFFYYIYKKNLFFNNQSFIFIYATNIQDLANHYHVKIK